MKIIDIHTSGCYPVIVGEKLLGELGKHANAINKQGKAAIISDSNVWPLYGKVAQDSLESAGFQVVNYVFPAGEASKTGSTYLYILNFLAENKLTRSDTLIALGGGVVGDITGFAAATYLRGISYIQIPTTLLAMVDSSVGGKTAIDLPAGKNLAGAFYQPSLVLCDISALETLPEDVFRSGCAEIIKYGVLYDTALFQHLNEKGIGFSREDVISRCIELKRDVVTADEFDRGERQKLNLGHTIGHGVEAGSNFAVSHGQAVAIGMAIVCKAGVKMGICAKDAYNKIIETLNRFALPTETTHSKQTLYRYALSDKKRSGGTVNLIIPKQIGNCIIHPITVEELLNFIDAGL